MSPADDARTVLRSLDKAGRSALHLIVKRMLSDPRRAWTFANHGDIVRVLERSACVRFAYHDAETRSSFYDLADSAVEERARALFQLTRDLESTPV